MNTPIGPLTAVPVACTFTPQAGREQVERWQAFDREHALRRESSPTALTVHYTRSTHAVDRLHELVAAESDCAGDLPLPGSGFHPVAFPVALEHT